MPPLAARRWMRMRGSRSAASASTRATCGDGEASSTRHSSQSPLAWAVTERSMARSTASGGS